MSKLLEVDMIKSLLFDRKIQKRSLSFKLSYVGKGSEVGCFTCHMILAGHTTFLGLSFIMSKETGERESWPPYAVRRP